MIHPGKILILFGIIVVVIGVLLTYGSKIPMVNRLGHLPGDIVIKRGNFTIYFPLATCILLSLILYVVMKLIHR